MSLRAARLVVIRHGETEWAKARRHTSRTDLDLTAVGVEVAQSLADVLKGFEVAHGRFAAVWSSPRLRAKRTAELAGFGPRMMLDDDLVEWFYGDDEGRTTAEIQVDHPGWHLWHDGPHNGESIDDASKRVDRVIERASQTAGGDVLIFAHGHILDILAARWVGLSGTHGRLFQLDPATVSILGWHRNDRVIQRWNSPT
jgi:broad specificity phosphatase PhoE